ncbi:MAG: hypothetical protein P4N41_01155 [Negativicutes bacterium]|nr:hypothetical protein [Negativicutes bacterium]
MIHLYRVIIKIHRVFCFALLIAILLAPSAYALPEGSNFRYQFSKDSDGVLTRSYTYESSDEEQELPFSYSVGYNHFEQAGGHISEQSFVGRWRRELPGDQAITLWAGVARNNLFTFVPYSAMYDKILSPKEHVWLSFEHGTIPTVEAYNARLYDSTYSFTYLNRMTSRLNLTTTFSKRFINDGNQEKIATVALEQKFNRNFKTSLIYGYDNAAFTNPGYYFVPQGQRVVSVKPEVNVDIGPGTLTAYAQEPLWARNNAGSVKYYNYGYDYQVGRFSVGYVYTKDDTYTSRVYTAKYQIEW